MKSTLKFIALILLILILAAGGYFYFNQKAAPVMTPKTVPQPIGLNFSQILNAQVPNTVSDDPNATVTLANGNYNDPNQTIALQTATSAYAIGDLNGDGASDVAAVMGVDTGGTGYFEYLLVYIDNNGVPKLAASQFLGDRITVNQVSINNGVISTNIITQGPNDPMCCPTMPETLSFKLSGSSLIAATSTAAAE